MRNVTIALTQRRAMFGRGDDHGDRSARAAPSAALHPSMVPASGWWLRSCEVGRSVVELIPPPARLDAMARLFLAVWPPDHVVEMLCELPRKDQRGVRFLPPENWHATLRFLGDADPDRVADAMQRATLPAATAAIGPAIDMLGAHSVMAPVSGLDELATATVEATDGLGTLDPRPTYTGHITIARVRRGAIVHKVVGMMCTASFPVVEVALIESSLHPTGSTYTTLNAWSVAPNE